MKKVILTFLIFFALVYGGAYRDVLFLQNGEELRCNVVSITSSSISVKTANGDTTLKIADVVRITMTHPRPGDEWKTISDVDDSLLLEVMNRVESAKEKYKGATYITLYDFVNFRFNADSSGRKTVRRIVLLLSERAKGIFATSSFSFISPWQRGDVDFCRTIAPDGNIYHLDDAALEFSQPNQLFPQYNFMRRIKFAPSQVSIGAVVDYQYHIDFDRADPIHPVYSKFIFAREEPVLEKVVSVEYPKSLGEKFLRFHSFEPPQTASNEDEFVFVWEKRDIEPYVREPMMAPTSMFLPTVWLAFAVDEAKMLRALSDSLKSSMDGSAELDNFIDSLTAQANTSREKFSKKYEFLNISFRKTDVPPDESRWFPRRVSKIFDDGIANSLDINALLIYMLRHIGVDAKLTYASSIFNAKAIMDVSSLGFFSNPLTVAALNGKKVPCMPQWKYLPYGIVSNFCDGQMALLIGDEGTQIAELLKNPIDVYEENDTFWISLAPDGDAEVQIKQVFGAKVGTYWRRYMEIRKEQEDRDFQNIAGDFNPGAELKEYSLYGINSLDSTVVVEINLSAPQLAQSAGEKLMAFHLPKLEYSTYFFGIPQRKTPMWYSSPSKALRVWMIRMPEKFSPKYIPEAVAINQDSLTYNLSARYDEATRTIIAVEDKSLTDRFIPPDEYEDFRKVAFRKAKCAKEWYIFEKK